MWAFKASRLRTRRASRLVASATAIVALVLFMHVAPGADIVRVEEDWKLVVGEPDTATVSPQVTCTMSPVGNLDSHYAVFDVNLRNFPSYEAGGVQLQLWSGGDTVNSVRSNTGVALETAGETITWTQRMTLADGNLSFAIVDGNSTTWGSFGTGSSILLATSSELENLNSYNPAVSVANSGVGYGSNRVGSLLRTAIRVYSAAGLEAQDNSPYVVYEAH
jgi:hypothetical protein